MEVTHTRATTIAAIRYAGIKLGMGPMAIRFEVRRFEEGATVHPEVMAIVRDLLDAPDVPAWDDAYRRWVGE